MKVTMFTSHCPKCEILKTILINSDISFTEDENLKEVIEAGFQSLPVLKVDNEYYQYFDAVKLIKEKGITN